ncbi:Ig-like domain repeat protein [Actinomadura harenae]|uniref:Ig-like domain repeat protein n=1 Tax=Actinomadura harenae TaxID=2483351 RepID=A0A3M2LL33_9ACTN|nr:Ig-like domain repeat protein [Actinomadura harenae]RMI38111.1 Ig-like domain repeat protein [Actinomadura harenae]
MRRSALLSLAATAVTVAASLPLQAAYAAPTVGTQFTGLSTSSTAVSYEHRTVTVQGRLRQLVQRQWQPLAGVPVDVRLNGATVGTTTTDADGSFSATVDLPSGGTLTAAFAGDDAHQPSRGDVASEKAERVGSRVLLDPTPATVRAGASVTFSGVAQILLDGVWRPLPRVPLTLTGDGSSRTTSGDDGRFAVTVPVAAPNIWSVSTDANADSYYRASDGVVRVIEAYDGTRVVSFAMPSKSEAHHDASATGRVQWGHGSQWGAPPHSPLVSLYYRPKGSKTWHTIGGVQTDEIGRFSILVSGPLGTADWQARVVRDDSNLAGTSGLVAHTITDQGHFANLSAWRSTRGTQVNAHLYDWYNGQRSHSTMRGLKVGLYYRHAGSKTWHWYRNATTGKNGLVSFSGLKLGKGYYFRLRLPAQGPYLTTTSKTFSS